MIFSLHLRFYSGVLPGVGLSLPDNEHVSRHMDPQAVSRALAFSLDTAPTEYKRIHVQTHTSYSDTESDI